ncbi:MAG: hypothetical protein ONB23_08410 [candidate division KSB1 bacterium]|nr:hypothetical protein [candidate division KSB1 bacterium]
MSVQHDDLVRRAEKLALSIQAELEEGKNQLTKAIDVVRESRSLRVFLNWLAYQAGRAGGSGFWQQKAGNSGALHTALAYEVEQIEKQYGKEAVDAVLWFLGYFRRAVIGREVLQKMKQAMAS